AGAVYYLPADERRGVFRASAGRAKVHALPAAGKSALRDHHRFGRKGDNREEAVSILDAKGAPHGMCTTHKQQVNEDFLTFLKSSILIDERADGVHLSYNRMARFVAPYGNAEALKVAQELDSKIEGLITAVAI